MVGCLAHKTQSERGLVIYAFSSDDIMVEAGEFNTTVTIRI